MIDPTCETLITIPEFARGVPPKGVHVSTAWRWALDGLADGRNLETTRIGGRTYTSIEAATRFLTPPSTKTAAASKQRQLQIDAAEKELSAYGI